MVMQAAAGSLPVQAAAGKQLHSPDHAQDVANAPAQLDALETITQGIVQVNFAHTGPNLTLQGLALLTSCILRC